MLGEGERRRRYVLCLNEEEARQATAAPGRDPRASSRPSWRAWSADHPKAACRLIASRRFGPYLSQDDDGRPYLDQAKVRRAEQLDGKFVLTTNDDTLSVADIALGYKGMWVIESCFRKMKTTGLAVRPMFHWMPHRITAHVKLCVLALMIQRTAEIATGLPWRRLAGPARAAQGRPLHERGPDHRSGHDRRPRARRRPREARGPGAQDDPRRRLIRPAPPRPVGTRRSRASRKRLRLRRYSSPFTTDRKLRPDPPTPFAHGTLPAVRPTIGPRPQPLRADPGRPALGRPRRRASAPGPSPVLRQHPLRAAHLRRAPARPRRALGPQDGAPRRPADGDRSRAGRGRRRPAEPRVARAGRAQHPAAAGPGGALATRGHARDPRGRRLGPAQAPQLRHRAGRPGAAAAGGAAARPRGGALWRHGCASIPASRSWRATAPAPTPTGSGAARPRRSRSPTVSTSCRTWPRRSRPRSPRTPRACARSSGRGMARPSPTAVPCRSRRPRRRHERRPWPPSVGSGAWPATGELGASPRGLARPRDRPAPRARPEHGRPLPAARDVPRAQGARRRRAEPARPLEAAPPGALDRRPARQPAPVPRAPGGGLPRHRHLGQLEHGNRRRGITAGEG